MTGRKLNLNQITGFEQKILFMIDVFQRLKVLFVGDEILMWNLISVTLMVNFEPAKFPLETSNCFVTMQ